MGLSLKLLKKVKGFTLDVEWEIGNEVAVLFGSSGAGKSMTLQLIAGLMEPDEGFIRSNGIIFLTNHQESIFLRRNALSDMFSRTAFSSRI